MPFHPLPPKEGVSEGCRTYGGSTGTFLGTCGSGIMSYVAIDEDTRTSEPVEGYEQNSFSFKVLGWSTKPGWHCFIGFWRNLTWLKINFPFCLRGCCSCDIISEGPSTRKWMAKALAFKYKLVFSLTQNSRCVLCSTFGTKLYGNF
jgi:hypothetical protein